MAETDYGLFLKDKYGCAGYGRWCVILEKVAMNIPKEHRHRCFRELPIGEWRRYLGCNKKQLFSLLNDLKQFTVFDSHSKEFQLLNYEISEKLLRIEIPILYDWCDNHTKNTSSEKNDLQVTNKQELKLNLKPELNTENKKIKLISLSSNNLKNSSELEKQANELLAYYSQKTNRHCQLTEARMKQIILRLNEPIYFCKSRLDDLKMAVDGLLDDWHIKNNQIDIELVIKSSEQVEKYVNAKKHKDENKQAGIIRQKMEEVKNCIICNDYGRIENNKEIYACICKKGQSNIELHGIKEAPDEIKKKIYKKLELQSEQSKVS